VSNADLTDLETRAAQLGYHYDGLIRVGEPALWTIVLVDGSGQELAFQADTIEGAIEIATDRLALLSGLVDL
jgi:hypothetical protein